MSNRFDDNKIDKIIREIKSRA